ncbi:MAG: amino acid racemase [Blastocatellia bacterium]|nr:amino acid racemase [Blastocatellia bacterium]
MAKHIGIVGCSAEGAALCYRTLCVEGAELFGRYGHPEVTLHTYPLAEYMKFIEADDWSGVARLMIASAEKVARCGADFAICPDNTIHQVFDQVIAASPIPWLHIAEEVAKNARERGFSKLGVLGTKFLMEGPVYPSRLAQFCLASEIPEAPVRERINDYIFDEMVNGKFTSEARSYFAAEIERMQHRGCDAVVLGCTEIPLLISPEDSVLPVLDSTRTLARSALRMALQPGLRTED